MEATAKKTGSKIHPHILGLWVACGSIMMMFAAFTSAYVVRHAAGNWLEFPLPGVFYANTAVIILSSITLHRSFNAFKTGNERMYKILLLITFFLGLTFIVLQYQGWMELAQMGVMLDGNPSGSFVYVISGIHAAHVLGGLAALGIALMHAYTLKYEVTPKRKVRFTLTLTYWHFVDFLWVYLLFFLIAQ